MILFRSGPHASAYIKGMDFSDNARALFEYMIQYQMNSLPLLSLIIFHNIPENIHHLNYILPQH